MLVMAIDAKKSTDIPKKTVVKTGRKVQFKSLPDETTSSSEEAVKKVTAKKAVKKTVKTAQTVKRAGVKKRVELDIVNINVTGEKMEKAVQCLNILLRCEQRGQLYTLGNQLVDCIIRDEIDDTCEDMLCVRQRKLGYSIPDIVAWVRQNSDIAFDEQFERIFEMYKSALSTQVKHTYDLMLEAEQAAKDAGAVTAAKTVKAPVKAPVKKTITGATNSKKKVEYPDIRPSDIKTFYCDYLRVTYDMRNNMHGDIMFGKIDAVMTRIHDMYKKMTCLPQAVYESELQRLHILLFIYEHVTYDIKKITEWPFRASMHTGMDDICHRLGVNIRMTKKELIEKIVALPIGCGQCNNNELYAVIDHVTRSLKSITRQSVLELLCGNAIMGVKLTPEQVDEIMDEWLMSKDIIPKKNMVDHIEFCENELVVENILGDPKYGAAIMSIVINRVHNHVVCMRNRESILAWATAYTDKQCKLMGDYHVNPEDLTIRYDEVCASLVGNPNICRCMIYHKYRHQVDSILMGVHCKYIRIKTLAVLRAQLMQDYSHIIYECVRDIPDMQRALSMYDKFTANIEQGLFAYCKYKYNPLQGMDETQARAFLATRTRDQLCDEYGIVADDFMDAIRAQVSAQLKKPIDQIPMDIVKLEKEYPAAKDVINGILVDYCYGLSMRKVMRYEMPPVTGFALFFKHLNVSSEDVGTVMTYKRDRWLSLKQQQRDAWNKRAENANKHRIWTVEFHRFYRDSAREMLSMLDPYSHVFVGYKSYTDNPADIYENHWSVLLGIVLSFLMREKIPLIEFASPTPTVHNYTGFMFFSRMHVLLTDKYQRILEMQAEKMLIGIIDLESQPDGEEPCMRCKSKKTTNYQMQTRSADEPMTTFWTCLNCGKKWRT